MNQSITQALENRRTYYSLNNLSPISDQQIEQIVKHAILHTPSAFNSQSTRAVVLFNENHTKLWQIVMDSLRAITPPEKFATTDQRIKSFDAAHATILYFEDQDVVEGLQKNIRSTPKTSRSGRNKPPECTNWPSGQCSKMPGLEYHFNTTTHSLTNK